MNVVTQKLLVILLIAQVFGDEIESVLESTPEFNLHATLLNRDSAVLEYDSHQIITYCLRPTNETKGIDILKRTPPEGTTSWTLRDLKSENITSEQLLSWSATVDLVENYEAYLLGHQLIDDSQLFYNCSLPWFGPWCEYAFVKFGVTTFSNFVHKTFDWKLYDEPDDVPCYVLLKCDRDPSAACLDWREICDGKIDCLDGGQDEHHCWQLEQSLENDALNEYRCHNGMQSISASFHRDGSFNPDCLDRSDEQTQVDYWNERYRDPSFRCEEHSCRSNRDGINLPCGDGQCVSRLQLCFNGRGLFVRKEADLLLISSHCEDLMNCLTKMRQSIDNIPSYIVCFGHCASEILEVCPSRFPYAPHFVVHGYIYFVNETDHANEEEDTILPSYICYDPLRCPLLSYQFSYNQSRCLYFEKMDIRSEHGCLSWRSLVFLIESYFRDHCSMDQTPSCPPSTMYRCLNSSKCISKSRLLDGVQDCRANDNEMYVDSCLLDHQYRFQCSDNRRRCLSSLLIHDGYHDCEGGEEEIEYSMDIARTQTNISFRTMCDGFRELEPILIDGQYHTDETECEYWPCDNQYTQCDGIWNCPDGIDEMFCSNKTLNESIDRLCITWTTSTLSSFFISIRNETNCSLPSLRNMFCLNRSTSSNVDMFKQWTTEKYLSFTQIYSLISGCEKNYEHLLPTVLEHQLFECIKRVRVKVSQF